VTRIRLQSVAAAGLATVLLLGAARVDPISVQLDGYADRSIAIEFTQYLGALYAHCPYALGSYSYIELVGIRRIHRTIKLSDEEKGEGIEERSELTLQPKKSRFYWNSGKKWIDWGRGPELRYAAERRRRAPWTFSKDQHVCAHGEPQDKSLAADLPRG
jgi:hypothetical protein